MKTIRIIGSKLQIVLPLWVRQELNIGLNHTIKFTPVCGMLLMTAGEEADLDITDPRFDNVIIPDKVLGMVGLSAYDLVEIITLGDNIYLIPYQRIVPKCQLCGSEDSVVDLQGIYLCDKCVCKDLTVIMGR